VARRRCDCRDSIFRQPCLLVLRSPVSLLLLPSTSKSAVKMEAPCVQEIRRVWAEAAATCGAVEVCDRCVRRGSVQIQWQSASRLPVLAVQYAAMFFGGRGGDA